MQISTAERRVIAVLGPTNTGKTHLAMERLLAHDSGVIGFPLRLLARENYDRAVKMRGAAQVALITGEEKIIPPNARYFLCTVEAMPLDRPVSFLAVDEIQMCADPDRGHIFTQRLLHARGGHETMFLGAETIRPLIRRLVPEAEFQTRPRMSVLRYAGAKKVTRLPPRSAVVAFSASQVYALAELVRRQRGGAAVVLGALSPRTRNAQVAMYQAGEVDYLVATDAIGMGLNMDIDHVAFAGTAKFDGRRMRDLLPAELAQAAGRAGRHMNDGTFGTTADQRALDEGLVAAIENHEFDALKQIYWRNSDLDFTTAGRLRQSLARPTPERGLIRARPAEDEQALTELLKNPDIVERATNPAAVRLLWDVCRIPDFQKVLSDAHTRLLTTLYLHLTDRDGRVPTDWMAKQVGRLDRIDGDIDALTQRIAHIRTWTYVSFHGDWLADAANWQGRTRAIEDKLSDALHERLTQRFVDKSTAHLMSRLKEKPDLIAAVNAAGDVLVEGHPVGHLKGFQFDFMGDGASGADRTVANAAVRALKGEIRRRVARLEQSPDDAFRFISLDGPEAGTIAWRDRDEEIPVARLVGGESLRRPAVRVRPSDLLDTADRERIAARLDGWFRALADQRFEALDRLAGADLKGVARGVAFQVVEALGSMPRRQVAEQLVALDREGRRVLRHLGLRIGRETVYLPEMLKPAQARLRGFLWCLDQGRKPLAAPPPGRVSVVVDRRLPAAFYEQTGFRRFGGLALRVDIVERVAGLAWDLATEGEAPPPPDGAGGARDDKAREDEDGEGKGGMAERKTKARGGFVAGPDLMNLAGCGADDLAGVLKGLGFRARQVDGEWRYRAPRPGAGAKSAAKKARGGRAKPAGKVDPHSPFAELKKLMRA